MPLPLLKGDREGFVESVSAHHHRQSTTNDVSEAKHQMRGVWRKENLDVKALDGAAR